MGAAFLSSGVPEPYGRNWQPNSTAGSDAGSKASRLPPPLLFLPQSRIENKRDQSPSIVFPKQTLRVFSRNFKTLSAL